MRTARVIRSAHCDELTLPLQLSTSGVETIKRMEKTWLERDYTHILLGSEAAQATYKALCGEAGVLSLGPRRTLFWGQWEHKYGDAISYRDAGHHDSEHSFEHIGRALTHLMHQFMSDAEDGGKILFITNASVASALATSLTRKSVKDFEAGEGFEILLDDRKLFYIEREFRLP